MDCSRICMNGCRRRPEAPRRPRLGLAGLALACVSTAVLAASVPGCGARCAVDPELRQRLQAAIDAGAGFDDRYTAEVWLLDMSQRLRRWIGDDAERIELLRLVHREATRAHLPAELVLAVIEVESGFDRWAISPAGAQGLMQVMPFWPDILGHPRANLHDPATNLRLGCTILRYYLDREHGDLRRALGRYNGSLSGRAYPERVFAALGRRWYRR